MEHGPDADAMIVKCPCGFWAHGRDDMVVAEVYEKHLAGCHQEGVVPEPEVESHPYAVMDTQRLRKLRDEVLSLAEHIANMTTIIGAASSANIRAGGWCQLSQSTEKRLRAMLERSTKCP